MTLVPTLAYLVNRWREEFRWASRIIIGSKSLPTHVMMILPGPPAI